MPDYFIGLMSGTSLDGVDGVIATLDAGRPRVLRDASQDARPLQDLALEAGFNSRSTFYAAFKKACGMTPAEWRKQHVRMSAPVGQDKKSLPHPDTGGDQVARPPPLSPGIS